MQDKLIIEQKRLNDIKIQQFKRQDMVFVQDDQEELTVDAVNQFSLQNAISKKSLEELH